MLQSIEDIKNVLYINLDERQDRKFHIQNELPKIGITCAQRVSAIRMKNGAVGCSMSHLKCLEIAKQQNWDHVLILEDDIQFLNPELLKTQLNGFLNKPRLWDVVFLGGNNVPPYLKVDEFCVKVFQCRCALGYIVKSHYYDTLIENIKEGVQHLMREPHMHVKFAVDMYWNSLQQKDNWFLIVPLSVTQLPGYSDIEKKNTDYTRVMVDLNKEWLFKNKK
jgi:glycosyl transferase family 25